MSNQETPASGEQPKQEEKSKPADTTTQQQQSDNRRRYWLRVDRRWSDEDRND